MMAVLPLPDSRPTETPVGPAALARSRKRETKAISARFPSIPKFWRFRRSPSLRIMQQHRDALFFRQRRDGAADKFGAVALDHLFVHAQLARRQLQRRGVFFHRRINRN